MDESKPIDCDKCSMHCGLVKPGDSSKICSYDLPTEATESLLNKKQSEMHLLIFLQKWIDIVSHKMYELCHQEGKLKKNHIHTFVCILNGVSFIFSICFWFIYCYLFMWLWHFFHWYELAEWSCWSLFINSLIALTCKFRAIDRPKRDQELHYGWQIFVDRIGLSCRPPYDRQFHIIR